MIKYQIMRISAEIPFRDRNKIESGVAHTYGQDAFEEECFTNLEEAKKEFFKNYSKSEIEWQSPYKDFWVTEYFLESNLYDEDDEWVETTDEVQEWSGYHIPVVDDNGDEAGTFTSYSDAEWEADRLNREVEEKVENGELDEDEDYIPVYEVKI